jgi:hypothetical protein
MPASPRQNDQFRKTTAWEMRLATGLRAAMLCGVFATASMAAYDPWNEPRPSNDPFEEAMPAASTAPDTNAAAASNVTPVASTAPATAAASSELRVIPETLPPPDDNAAKAQQFARRLAQLPTEEQLPGIPPTVAPDQSANDNWSPRPLGEMSINIRLPNGMLPRNYWAEHAQPAPLYDTCGTNRSWPMDCYHWCPSGLCYQPLYFEEPNLERYGYGCGCCTCCCSTCVQSACSAAHFFGTVPALPYMMAANCPCECNYALGDYRPGDCVPWRYQCCAPCSAAGGISEGAAAYGMILMLP